MNNELTIGGILISAPRVAALLGGLGALIVPALPYFKGLNVAVQVAIIAGIVVIAVGFIASYAYYVTKRKVAEIQKAATDNVTK